MDDDPPFRVAKDNLDLFHVAVYRALTLEEARKLWRSIYCLVDGSDYEARFGLAELERMAEREAALLEKRKAKRPISQNVAMFVGEEE